MDLAFEGVAPSLSDTSVMAALKTGELIAASLQMGAALAGAGEPELKLLRTAGLMAGEAFQIADDLLNLEGDPALMGKAAGTDAVRGKATSTSLLGPVDARAKAEGLREGALLALSPLGSDKLEKLVGLMTARAF